MVQRDLLAAEHAHEVPQHADPAEFIGEKQPHARESGHDGEPVRARRPLAEQPGAEERDPDRGGVLEQDGVGRSGQLVGEDKRDGAGRVRDGGADLHPRPREFQPMGCRD